MGQTKLNRTQLKTPDTCYVQKNSAGANQTIANNTATALTFDSEVIDTNTMHDNSTNNSRITIKKTGYYLINAAIRWETTNSGGYSRKISIYVGGSEIATNIMLPVTTASTSAPSQVISTILSLSATNYVELYVYQDSGTTLDISRWTPHTYLQCVQIA